MRWLPLLLEVYVLYLGIRFVLAPWSRNFRNAPKTWEVEEGGSWISIFGWTKVIRPPTVVAQGNMSLPAARAIFVAIGLFFIFGSVFGIRHLTGFPGFLPDLFAKV